MEINVIFLVVCSGLAVYAGVRGWALVAALNAAAAIANLVVVLSA